MGYKIQKFVVIHDKITQPDVPNLGASCLKILDWTGDVRI